MKQVAVGSLLASVALFLWGFVFWASPLAPGAMLASPDDAALSAALSQHLPATGTYFVPNAYSGDERFAELIRSGPIATIHFRTAGAPPTDPAVMAAGFAHMLVVVVLLALLLRAVAPALTSFAARAGLVLLVGVTTAVWSDLGDPIWFYQPWTYHVLTAVYDVVAFALAGLILAAYIRPVTAPAARGRALAGA